MSRDTSFSRLKLSGISLPRFFARSRTQRSSRFVKVWKLTTSPPSRDRSALTMALKTFTVEGTTICFSAYSWAIRLTGQDARNQTRKG